MERRTFQACSSQCCCGCGLRTPRAPWAGPGAQPAFLWDPRIPASRCPEAFVLTGSPSLLHSCANLSGGETIHNIRQHSWSLCKWEMLAPFSMNNLVSHPISEMSY